MLLSLIIDLCNGEQAQGRNVPSVKQILSPLHRDSRPFDIHSLWLSS